MVSPGLVKRRQRCGIDPQRSQSKGIEKRRRHYDAAAQFSSEKQSEGGVRHGSEKQRHGITELRRARAKQRTDGRGKAWQSSERNGYGMKRTAKARHRRVWQRMAEAKSGYAVAKHAVHYIERRRQGEAGSGIELRRRGIELTAMRSKGIEWNRQVMIARAKHGTLRQR